MKILKSLVIVLAMVALVSGATSAVFTSQATVAGNTFSSGVLEIKINGQASIPGFNVTNAVPGERKSGWFVINNCGLKHRICEGESTLAAKKMTLSAKLKDGADARLFDKLQIKVETNRGYPDRYPDGDDPGSVIPGPYPPQLIYEGFLSGLTDKNLLLPPHWTILEPRAWQIVYYTVTLPLEVDNSYQDLSTTFDFVVDAASS